MGKPEAITALINSGANTHTRVRARVLDGGTQHGPTYSSRHVLFGRQEAAMIDIHVEETLWCNSIAPTGVLLTWRAPDGVAVGKGAHLADVMIEGCTLGIMAPADGRLVHSMEALDILEPGVVIGRIEPH